MGEIVVTAPFDGAEIGTVPSSNAAQVEAALASAYALYQDRDTWLPKPKRIEILRRAAEIVRERRVKRCDGDD